MCLANSQGFVGSRESTGLAAYLPAVARDKEAQTAGPGLWFSIFHNDLDPQEIGHQAARSVVELSGGKPVKTQKAFLGMDPLVGVEFLSFVSAALTAESIQQGRSLLVDKLGHKAASNKVNLPDHGRLVQDFASAPFDGEGIPSLATRLSSQAILQQSPMTPAALVRMVLGQPATLKEGLVATCPPRRRPTPICRLPPDRYKS